MDKAAILADLETRIVAAALADEQTLLSWLLHLRRIARAS